MILLRNLNLNEGLCNGTKLSVKKLLKYSIEAQILSGKNRKITLREDRRAIYSLGVCDARIYRVSGCTGNRRAGYSDQRLEYTDYVNRYTF